MEDPLRRSHRRGTRGEDSQTKKHRGVIMEGGVIEDDSWSHICIYIYIYIYIHIYIYIYIYI